MLKLQTTETPLVHFRADLPAWLEPKGAAFIEIESRPAGQINQPFMAACEGVNLALRMREAAIEKITDPSEAVKARADASRQFGRDWLGAVYDTCITSWLCNLVDQDAGRPVTCDRETFLALADVPIEQIGEAFAGFQKAISDAGKAALAETDATIKN